jgi:hypothetical protein
MKVVINRCYGGFSLSYAAVMAYAKRKGIKLYSYTSARGTDGHLNFEKYVPYDGKSDAFLVYYSTVGLDKKGGLPDGSHFADRDIKRDDPDLVAVVEKLGDKADGKCAKLAIVTIPDGVEWEVTEYDGMERVEKVHRSWS